MKIKLLTIKSLRVITLTLCIASFCFAAIADNKVVVIPMAGDEVPVALMPTSSVARVDPVNTDYTISGFFTVSDDITGLEWQRGDSPVAYGWEGARTYCADLDLGGHEDWRLPSVTELHSIVDYGSSIAPLINVAFVATEPNRHWSASTRAISSGTAWHVNFFNGSVFSSPKTVNHFVRCVR